MVEPDIARKLAQLEARIVRLEAQLEIQPAEEITESEPVPASTKAQPISAEHLEFQIGQFWLAKTGIVILAIGIAFLLTFPYEGLPSGLPSLFGFVLVMLLFSVSYAWRTSYTYISSYLLGGAILLLYFTALRMHFFGADPLIENRYIEIGILATVVAINLIISIYNKSVFLAGVSLTLGYITAIVSEQAYFIFLYISLLAAVATYLYIKFNWTNLFGYITLLTYTTHLLWYLNLPVMGNRMGFVSGPELNILFILIYAAIFAAGNLLRDKNIPENNSVISTGFLNCLGAFTLFLLVTITKFQTSIFTYHMVASGIFLGVSVLFWIREQSKVSTFFYAIAGYSTLSIALISRFENPDFFILLSWQSILVISTAIWYRSKFIIVANFIIFLVIFIAYLSISKEVSPASLSFGIVALFSARIMNWQKHRLDLKTEIMRTAYLVSAFFMFPYALYHIVPERLVSIAWIGIALVYYLLSHVLKNVKYRWMALLTLLLTVVYIMIIGIIRLEPGHRIITFIVLGLVLLTTSFIYTRLKSKSADKK